MDRGDSAVPVFMLRQVAENVIRVSGFSHSSLLVHFGATKQGATKQIDVSPLPKLNRFVDCIVRDVSDEMREQVSSFFTNVFSGVLRAGHGTLAAVMPKSKRTVPKAFQDGTPLSPRISIPARVKEMLIKSDCTSNARLQASSALITGMLLSDGITLFRSDGTVWAYNIFIKHPRGLDSVVGGARTRTFRVMRNLVGADLVAAFIQSQDGRVDFYGKGK